MRKELDFNGKKLVYNDTGNGPLVVLVHGFGEDSTVWKNQLDALAAYRLILPDLPGSGESEMIADMSMEGLADAVKFILDAELKNNDSNAQTRCTMIGHSMGGYITLAFAEIYPEYLEGFGLFHSSAYADSEEKKETRRKGIDFINRNGAFEFLKTAIPNLYSPVTKEKNPEIIQEQIQVSRNFSDAALVSYYESMMQRPNRVDILKNSHIPVLFILGKYDNAVPLKDGLEQCHFADISLVYVLDRSGHMGMQEEPIESNQMLLDFLKLVI